MKHNPADHCFHPAHSSWQKFFQLFLHRNQRKTSERSRLASFSFEVADGFVYDDKQQPRILRRVKKHFSAIYLAEQISLAVSGAREAAEVWKIFEKVS
jgi:hypothetical protein